MAEVEQESKRVKLEITPRDKAIEIGKIVCKNFEGGEKEFNGGFFLTSDVSFTVFGWKYYMAMIREDVFLEDPGFINRGSVIPLAKSFQVENPCSHDEASVAFNRNIICIKETFHAVDYYFKGVEGLDKKTMSIDINGTAYFLVLHSKYSLHQRWRLVDEKKIIPLDPDVLMTDDE